jgi:hypothetical protein
MLRPSLVKRTRSHGPSELESMRAASGRQSKMNMSASSWRTAHRSFRRSTGLLSVTRQPPRRRACFLPARGPSSRRVPSYPHSSDSGRPAALAVLLLGSTVSCTQLNSAFDRGAADAGLGGETDETSTSSSHADSHPAGDGSTAGDTDGVYGTSNGVATEAGEGTSGTSSGVATEAGEETSESNDAAKLVFVTSETYPAAEIGGLASLCIASNSDRQPLQSPRQLGAAALGEG